MGKSQNIAPEEEKVLELLREKQYQTITIRIKEGRIVNIKREESIDLDTDRSSQGNRKNLSL